MQEVQQPRTGHSSTFEANEELKGPMALHGRDRCGDHKGCSPWLDVHAHESPAQS